MTLEVDPAEKLEVREICGGEGFRVGIGWSKALSGRSRSSPKITLLGVYGEIVYTRQRDDEPLTI